MCLCCCSMMQTHSCPCPAHPQLLRGLVLRQLGGSADPFSRMPAKVPWERFCIIEKAGLEMPQGSFGHELDYP